MPSDRFQIAAERAVSSYPAEEWFNLSPSEQAAAIYRELRKLDAEAISESEAAEAPAAEGGDRPPKSAHPTKKVE
jgi:hypothetical protein